MGLSMIEHPVYKERYQYNVISKSFVSFKNPSLRLRVRLPSPQILAVPEPSLYSLHLLTYFRERERERERDSMMAFLKSPFLGIYLVGLI